MPYPIIAERVYVNPSGNVAASGLYRSHHVQELANDFPEWMHLRQNPRSIGQQFLAATAIHMDSIDKDLEYNITSKFLNTAPVDEIDVLYQVPIPSNVNLLDASASGIRCIAAPSGCSPSGVSQIHLKEASSLEEFYCTAIPTRLNIEEPVACSGAYEGFAWNTKPSGVMDKDSPKYDVWKKRHDISWCYDSGLLRKQDVETMEDYETYTVYPTGTIVDMAYNKGVLFAIKTSGGSRYVSLISTKTDIPVTTSAVAIADFLVDSFPEGILIDNDKNIWVSNAGKTLMSLVKPVYDYFIVDKAARRIYFREDYRSSGVFISNT